MVKKFLVILICLILLMIPMQVSASAAGVQTHESISPDGTSTPYIIVNREKTVINTYSSYSSIPESISYSEYDSGAWWHGILFLDSVQNNGTYWTATFTGHLQANI